MMFSFNYPYISIITIHFCTTHYSDWLLGPTAKIKPLEGTRKCVIAQAARSTNGPLDQSAYSIKNLSS